MMFAVVSRVIGSKVEERKGFFVVSAVFGQKPWINPFGFSSKVQIC